MEPIGNEVLDLFKNQIYIVYVEKEVVSYISIPIVNFLDVAHAKEAPYIFDNFNVLDINEEGRYVKLCPLSFCEALEALTHRFDEYVLIQNKDDLESALKYKGAMKEEVLSEVKRVGESMEYFNNFNNSTSSFVCS